MLKDLKTHCRNSIREHIFVDYVKILRQGYQDEETESCLESLEKGRNIEVIRVDRNVGRAPGRSLILLMATTLFIMTR